MDMHIKELSKQYLALAEEMFGPRVTEWSYGGVEVNDSPPHLKYYPDVRTVTISLSEKVRDDLAQLAFQLGHEVCHLLYPTMDVKTFRREPTTVFNEGVSTWFSVLVAGRLCDGPVLVQNLRIHSPAYYEAYNAVTALLELEREAIRKLRAVVPLLNRIEGDHFDQAGVAVPDELKDRLLATFAE